MRRLATKRERFSRTFPVGACYEASQLVRNCEASAPIFLDKLSAQIFHARAESIECAAKSVKTMELANKGRVQYGARDITVRMRIVCNMKREGTSLIIYRHIEIHQDGQ